MASSFDPDGEIVKRGVPNIREKIGRRRFMKGAGTATVAASMGLAGCSNPADQGEDSSGGGPIPDEPLRMACIGFTSGPASVFGTPMMQSARMVVDQINENGGILGEREIEMEEFDENVDEVVQQYRRLATREEFDVIVGYISSANVLSIAPIAEELEQPTVVWDTGTTNLFDDAVTDPQYIFRTCASSSTDAVGAARLLQNALPDVETVAGVNQDYAFGRNNWDLFQRAVESLGIDVELVDARFTPFPNDDYSSTISALNDTNPDFIYSSHWGGDAVNFITQANNQGLFDDTSPVSPREVTLSETFPTKFRRAFSSALAGPTTRSVTSSGTRSTGSSSRATRTSTANRRTLTGLPRLAGDLGVRLRGRASVQPERRVPHERPMGAVDGGDRLQLSERVRQHATGKS